MCLSGAAPQAPGILCLLSSSETLMGSLNIQYDNVFLPAKQKCKFMISCFEFVCISHVSSVLSHTHNQTLAVINVRFTLSSSRPPGSIQLYSLHSKEDFILMFCFPLRMQSFTKSYITACDTHKIPTRQMQMVVTATHTLSVCQDANLKGKNLHQ